MYLVEIYYKALYNQLKKNGTEPVSFICLLSSLALFFGVMNIIMCIDVLSGTYFSFFLKRLNEFHLFSILIILSFLIYFFFFKILDFKKNGDKPDGLFYITNIEKRIVWILFTTNILLFFALATVLNK